MNAPQFTWRPTYKALVDWLLCQEEDQEELISLLKQVGVAMGMYDCDEHWERSLLKEIDPFTFFSYLNKFGDPRRLQILIDLHNKLNLQCDPPQDVLGLPTCNPMKVWLFPYKPDRKESDIANLWEMFRQTVRGNIDENLLEKVLAIPSVGKGKLSIVWFYTAPDRYLTLDSRTCRYLQSKNLEFAFDTYAEYRVLIERTRIELGASFEQISYDAWQYSRDTKKVERIGAGANDHPENLEIKSTADLLEYLFADSKMDTSMKQAHFFYRGHASTKFILEPGIYRFLETIKNEDTIFKEMEHSAPDEFSGCSCTFDKLVKMQHYELPTRLLDITSNPLVALYFACVDEKHKNEDGVFYQFEIDNKRKELIKYADSDAVSVVANIVRRPITFNIDDQEELDYLYHEIRCCDKPSFLKCIDPKDFERVFFVTPKRNNPRIIKQEGAFFFFGIAGEKQNCPKLDNFFSFKTYSIPQANKETIVNELNVLGINQASLFPEIDKAAAYIKDKYSKEDDGK